MVEDAAIQRDCLGREEMVEDAAIQRGMVVTVGREGWLLVQIEERVVSKIELLRTF